MRVATEGTRQHIKARETLAHKKLKMRARLFLEDTGCADIQEEYTIGVSLNGSMRADVVGFKDNRIIVVECGGSTEKKLSKAWSYIDELWILPYGEDTLFQWLPHKKICHTCGHRV